MKKRVILLIYGEGGHKAQMARLIKKLRTINSEVNFIGINENSHNLHEIDINYSFDPLRDKYSNIKTLINFPKVLVSYFKIILEVQRDYSIQGVISTGPGIALPVSLYFKLFGKKIVFIETWSRFETQSMTGKGMYKIADKFYIQNKSLQKYYPNAIYGGLL